MKLSPNDYKEIQNLFNKRESEVTMSNYDDIYNETRLEYIKNMKLAEIKSEDGGDYPSDLVMVNITKDNLSLIDSEDLFYYFNISLHTEVRGDFYINHQIKMDKRNITNFFKKNSKRCQVEYTKVNKVVVCILLKPKYGERVIDNKLCVFNNIEFRTDISDTVTEVFLYEKTKKGEKINHINIYDEDVVYEKIKSTYDLSKHMMRYIKSQSSFAVSCEYNKYNLYDDKKYTKLDFNNDDLDLILNDYNFGTMPSKLTKYTSNKL